MKAQALALCLLTLLAALVPGASAMAQATPAERQEEIIRGLGMDPAGSEGHYLRGSAVDRLPPAHRETRSLSIAQPFGLAYLPLMVARQYGLIEKHARRLNHPELRVSWSRFPSEKAMSDALRAGFLNVAAGGVAGLLRDWDRDGGNTRGIAALSATPLYLNARAGRIRSLADFGPGDRIAVPGPTSHQAVLLRMAAARQLGPSQARSLDPLMVTLPHPDATAALAQGRISAHFSAPPYQTEELALADVHRLIASSSLTDGQATFSVLWAREELPRDHPRTYLALRRGLEEAIKIIESEPGRAAESYRLQSETALAADEIRAMLERPEMRFGMEPSGTLVFARFMHAGGELRRLPGSEGELFFRERFQSR